MFYCFYLWGCPGFYVHLLLFKKKKKIYISTKIFIIICIVSRQQKWRLWFIPPMGEDITETSSREDYHLHNTETISLKIELPYTEKSPCQGTCL